MQHRQESEMVDTSLSHMFFERARRVPSRAAFRMRPKPGAPYGDITFREAATRIENIAAGLLTVLDPAIAVGKTITITSETRLEWVLCDYAAQSLGLRVASVYATLLAPEAGYIHVDTGAELAIVESKAQLEKVREFKKGFSFFDIDYAPDRVMLKKIIVIDPTGIDVADDWESLAAVEERGAAQRSRVDAEIADRRQRVKRSDVATYVYTSGTTGPPKGVTQTHDNHLCLIETAEYLGLFNEESKETGAFLFLPLAHAFERLIEYGAAFYEVTVVFAGVPTLLEDLQATRPGLLPAAPRVYEKIYSKIQQGLETATMTKKKLFAFSMASGLVMFKHRENKTSPSLAERVRFRIADKLVLSKIRARLGLDRITVMVSGSAPLAREVQEFFGAAGLAIYEGYGLTETTPVLSANARDDFRCGTVGKVIRGVTVRIADDGEILAKGPNITSGYLNRPDANAEAFDSDGWFHTGDIGEFDGAGFLRITDRKKDLLKTSGGKYIAPVKIEAQLKLHPLVYEAVVIGDNKKYVTALIALEQESLKAWATRTGNAPDLRSKAVLDEVQAAVDTVNKGLARFETIKYFRLMDEEPSVENGMLTASFKVKRKAVVKRYQSLIDEMYESEKGLAA
jgi:long-chain acyl-CoA synthetase